MSLRRVPFVLSVVALLAGATFALADETERVQRTIPLSPGGTLKLDNFSGHVTITGTDRAEVVIDAVRRAPRERLDRIKLDIQSSGSVVTIEANKKVSSGGWFDNNVVETDLDIQVPRHTNLQVHVFSSPVKVTDVSGNHDFKGFSSELRLLGVTGPVKAETFSGNITLQENGAERPELNLHTFSGDVDLMLAATARADVTFDSFSGDLKSDLPLTVRTSSRKSVKGELNAAPATSASSRIVIKTFSGDARIRK